MVDGLWVGGAMPPPPPHLTMQACVVIFDLADLDVTLWNVINKHFIAKGDASCSTNYLLPEFDTY